MSCIIMQQRTCTTRSESSVLWEKKNIQTPKFMYYFETLRQGRLLDGEEIPDCNEQDGGIVTKSTQV